VNDKSIQCFVGTYWIYAMICVAMIFLYVLGWPTMVFIFLKHHHDLQAVKLVQGAVSDYDRARVVGLNPPPHSNDDPQHQQPVATDTRGGASEVESDSNALLFSKFVSQTKPGGKTADLHDGAPVKHTAWLRVRRFKWWESVLHVAKLSTPRAGDLWVQLEVEPLMKRDVSDGGAVLFNIPVNILDCDPQLGLYAKPFIRLYEDRYYFWGTVEILRKLFQTSFVVIIQIVDVRFDLLYSLLVSYLFITLQAYFSPYVCDIDDRLSIAFLMNEMLILLSLMGITYVEAGWDDRNNGAALLAMQGLLGAYLTYIIWTVKARPLFNSLQEKRAAILATHGGSHRQALSLSMRRLKWRLSATSSPGGSQGGSKKGAAPLDAQGAGLDVQGVDGGGHEPNNDESQHGTDTAARVARADDPTPTIDDTVDPLVVEKKTPSMTSSMISGR